MANFEGYDRQDRQNKRMSLPEYGFECIDETRELCLEKGIDVAAIVRGIQPIAFDNAVWAYTLGAANRHKKRLRRQPPRRRKRSAKGLQAFCIPGSVADQRDVGLGHGNLGAMLLREETKCFCFLAGHESFAAAEGAIGIASTANKVRKEPAARHPQRSWQRRGLHHLPHQRLHLCGNGLRLSTRASSRSSKETPFSDGRQARRSSATAPNDVREGVAIMQPRGRRRLHHRQLHQPHALPAPGCRHLQKMGHRKRQEILLRRFRRRHGHERCTPTTWRPVPLPTA